MIEISSSRLAKPSTGNGGPVLVVLDGIRILPRLKSSIVRMSAEKIKET